VGGYYVYHYYAPGVGLVAQKRWQLAHDVERDDPYFQMILTDFCVRDAE